MLRPFGCCALVTLLVAGCSKSPPSEGTPSAAATATATPTPTPTPTATATATATPTETANVIPARTRSDDGNHRRILGSADRKYEAGRFLEAVEDYRRAVALRPTGPANVGLARALYDANQSAEALRTLEEAIAEDGRYAPAWLLLGEIKQASGKDAQARAAYQRFLQLAPDGDQARAVREILARQK